MPSSKRPEDTEEEEPTELQAFITSEIMNGMVHLDDHEGLLNATKAVMIGVASGGIGEKRGTVLLAGVRTALAIQESKSKRAGPSNPLRVGPESVTPDGPFGFKAK